MSTTIAQVRRALSEYPELCKLVIATFKDIGGSTTRWSVVDRWKLVAVLTHLADAEELRTRGRVTAAHDALGAVRRRVEDELNAEEFAGRT